MKKIITIILLFCVSISLFAGDMYYYYEYENRYALSIGSGYDYYSIEEKDAAGDYQPLLTIDGMTLNFKAEMPLVSLSGISLFLDTSLMIPSTGTFNSATTPVALTESTYLSNLAFETLTEPLTGTLNYILLNNNIGMNILGSITPSFLFYFGAGLEVAFGHSYFTYADDDEANQTLRTGYIGIGIFQSSGIYYEFTNNIALNLGINTSYDFLIYNYYRYSADSSLNTFEKLDAKGNNYLGKVMLSYNF